MSPPHNDAAGRERLSPGSRDFGIRPWVLADIPAIRRITLEAWLDAYSHFIPEDDLRDYFAAQFTAEALGRAMTSPDVHGYVAEEAGRTIAWMRTLWDEGAHRCSMASLYVHPSSQGRGAGAKLLQVAERSARSHGVGELWLGVFEENTPALQWYKDRGFAVRTMAPFTMGKTTVNHCICVKRLGAKGPEDEV